MLGTYTHVKNYIYTKMLHGTILYPEVQDDFFITSLHEIKRVKWDAVISTVNSRLLKFPSEILPANCNMVTILDPDFTSFGFLAGLVRKGCHLFLTEKQKMTSTERMNLIELAEEGNTLIQVRNDLLFHPSLFRELKSSTESKIIEIHHTVPGQNHGLQKMLYSNLLIIIKMIESEPSRISVCSIPGLSSQPDVVNVHLNFNNGSAASLTLSFNGNKKEHLLSVHSASGVISYNFMETEEANATPEQEPADTQIHNLKLLIKQIATFSDCILRQNFHQSGLNNEAKTYRLIEKINQKLEFSPVLV